MRARTALGLVCAALLVAAGLAPGAAAQTWKLTTLYSFCASGPPCTDGAWLSAGLISDERGDLFGTTFYGGAGNGFGIGIPPGGTVFEVTPNAEGRYTESVLYNFCSEAHCPDSGWPVAGLISDEEGDLFGTTSSGGTGSPYGGSPYGAGAVFELTPNAEGGYAESVLYSFCSAANCTDGAAPKAALTSDATGDLFGTTSGGGNESQGGVVFELTPNLAGGYAESVLYSFCSEANCVDGYGPVAGLISDAKGNLFGTTSRGGNRGRGVVFELTPTLAGGYAESVLHSFCSEPHCRDGDTPVASLISDKEGDLFGTTQASGKDGPGLVFELIPTTKGRYRESVLYRFRSFDSLQEGENPAAGLIRDEEGDLFGTTDGGGYSGAGVIFELTPNLAGGYAESVLHDFCSEANCLDGFEPFAGVIRDRKGRLFGTTRFGGAMNSGTVFRLSP